jgi:hypothetical protein
MRAMLSLLICAASLTIVMPSQARNTVAYFSLNPGYQWYDTTELIIDKDQGTPDNELVPTPGFMPELRLGFNMSGFGGLEAFLGGHWWGGSTQTIGGGGVAGALLRLTPLEALQYVWEPMQNRFIDVGLSFGAGYTLVGEDFAYQGWFLQYGFYINFFIFPFLSIGFELPIRQMFYAPFRYTNFGDRTGLCTNGGTVHDKQGNEVTRTAVRELTLPDGSNLGALEKDSQGRVTGNYILTEYKEGESGAACTQRAPEVWQYTPMLKITFLVDFGV